MKVTGVKTELITAGATELLPLLERMITELEEGSVIAIASKIVSLRSPLLALGCRTSSHADRTRVITSYEDLRRFRGGTPRCRVVFGPLPSATGESPGKSGAWRQGITRRGGCLLTDQRAMVMPGGAAPGPAALWNEGNGCDCSASADRVV